MRKSIIDLNSPSSVSRTLFSPKRYSKSFRISISGKENVLNFGPNVITIGSNDDESEKRLREESIARQEEQGSFNNSSQSISNQAFALSNTKLRECYSDSIRLCALNKVNAKNAFQMKLIDYMGEMLKRKSEFCTFQLAAGTLDASAKIYSYRVDSVHNDTLKMANNISGPKHKEKPTAADHNKQIRKKNTIENNTSKLNFNKLDMKTDASSLFDHLRYFFEEKNNENGSFINTFDIETDSLEVKIDLNDCYVNESLSNVAYLSYNSNMLNAVLQNSNLKNASICSTFRSILSNNNVTPDESQGNDRIDWDMEETNNFSAELNEDNRGPADDFIKIDDMQVQDHSEELKKSLPSSVMSVNSLLSFIASHPSDYSYFDSEILSAWAGPHHWKFKMPPIVSKNKDYKSAKEKKGQVIHFGAESISYAETFYKQNGKGLTLTKITMKQWESEKITLPEYIHYKTENYFRFYGKSNLAIKPMASNEEKDWFDNSQVIAYDYNNPNDSLNFCPSEEANQNLISEEYPVSSDIPLDNFENCSQQCNISGLFLVDIPAKIPRIEIAYTKMPKIMNMKKLKVATWSLLSGISVVQWKTFEGIELDALPNITIKEIYFSDVFNHLPERITDNMAHNLSVQLAFASILHLANEKNLELVQLDDMSDILIKQFIS